MHALTIALATYCLSRDEFHCGNELSNRLVETRNFGFLATVAEATVLACPDTQFQLLFFHWKRTASTLFLVRWHRTHYIMVNRAGVPLRQASAVIYSMRSHEYDVAGVASTSPPSMPSPTVHTERSGANSPSVFTSKHVSVRAGKETYISRIAGGEVFLLCARWQCKMFVVLDSSKKVLINGTPSDIMILYSVASPPLTLPTYPFSHYMCIAGCVVRRHCEATLSTWLPMPALTLIVPRAWEIGYTQPCIKCQGKSATHFVYFWFRKTVPYTHLEATSYIPQQDQSLPIWTTSLSTTGCYKNKYTIQFLWMACISGFATAILSRETELHLAL